MKTTIEVEQESFDPRKLKRGELFCFTYKGQPTIILMRLHTGAVVLARNVEGCGCDDKVGNEWLEDSLNPNTSAGYFHPFCGTLTFESE